MILSILSSWAGRGGKKERERERERERKGKGKKKKRKENEKEKEKKAHIDCIVGALTVFFFLYGSVSSLGGEGGGEIS